MTRSIVSTLLALSLTACGGAQTAAPCPACPGPVAAVCPPIGETAVDTDAASARGVVDDGVVRLDGTPEVPAALHDRLQQYLETRSATLQGMSDDGSAMLITTRFADTAQLHALSTPMGARRQLTFTSEPVYGAAFYPSDDHVVLVHQDVGGTENYQLYRVDLRTGRRTLVTDGRSRNIEFLFTRDGSRLAYVSNARNGRDMDVWMSDGSGPGEIFLERAGDWHVVEFSRDGSQLLLQEFVSITDSRLYLVDVATRAVTRVSPEGATGADRAAAFSADGRSIYVVSDRGSEVAELYEVSLADPARVSDLGAWRPLTRAITWNVEEVALSPDGRTLAFGVNVDGISELRLLDTRSRRVTPIAGLPRGVMTGLRFAREAPVVGFSISASRLSGDAFTYDLRTRRTVRWTESEMGGLDPEALVEPTLIHYPSFDQRQIPAFYYRPRTAPAGARMPVVIQIHGGPEAQARPWFYPLVQYLAAEAGIAVITPNVRGSDGYGKSYLALDDGRLREDSVRDIGALLDWIGTQPELDPSRVAVFGGSYGGYMVLASLVHFGDRLRAGVDIVGIANFVTFLENTASYRRDLRRVEYGDESNPEMRTFLAGISPVTHVDRIQSALFVAHGANDPRVPAAEAEQIVSAVRGGGHDVWYMLARDEGHGFLRKSNRDRFNELSAMFLEQHLLR
ncbi:MAG: alpha/beta fold hydrolase [Deltaproteobacteria bacterium]|nr:alpha/beta fold hydrolase [Deltaproteobacteria bacterium]